MATLNIKHVKLNSETKLDFIYRNKLRVMTSSLNEAFLIFKST